MCRAVLCHPVSCRNRLVLNGKCTSHRTHVKLNVHVTFEGTSHWMYVTLNVRHLECKSLKVYGRVKRTRFLGLSFRFFYLRDLNTSARCTRRGAYAGNFCANGRFSRPVRQLLDCRPPLLMSVELDGGRMLSTSARTTDTCTAPLIADTGFQKKGTGTTTAGYLCMTSTHKWSGLEISLSLPVLVRQIECKSH